MENKRPLSVTNGRVYIDGVLVADSCKYNAVLKPKVWEGKALGDQGTNRRWIGYDITGTIDAWKTNNLYKEKALEYIKSGKTPEMTIYSVNDDTNSDFYDKLGKKDELTLVGCVLTGDIPLMDLDTDGDVAKISVAFGAKNLIA